MSQIMMKARTMRLMDEMFKNDIEGRELLDLVAAEFSSDPQSVQCFDLRIVERVRLWAAREKRYREMGLRI